MGGESADGKKRGQATGETDTSYGRTRKGKVETWRETEHDGERSTYLSDPAVLQDKIARGACRRMSRKCLHVPCTMHMLRDRVCEGGMTTLIQAIILQR